MVQIRRLFGLIGGTLGPLASELSNLRAPLSCVSSLSEILDTCLGIRTRASAAVIIRHFRANTTEGDGFYIGPNVVRCVLPCSGIGIQGRGVFGSHGVSRQNQRSARFIHELHPAIAESRHRTMKTPVYNIQ